jgi:hypothetical protein
MIGRKKRSRSSAFEAKMALRVAACLQRLDPMLKLTPELDFKTDLQKWRAREDALYDWSAEASDALSSHLRERDSILEHAYELRVMIALSDENVPVLFTRMNDMYDDLVCRCTMIGREPVHALRRMLDRILSAALLYPALEKTYRSVDGDQRLADMGITRGQFTIFEAKPTRHRKRAR